jgi:PAS domain S-box-containing protein
MRSQLQTIDRDPDPVPHTIRDGTLIVDRQGRILEVNDILCGMLGHMHEELLTMRVADLEVSQIGEQAHLRSAFEQGFHDFVSRFRKKDGSLVDVQVSAAVVDGGRRPRLFAFVRDLTGRGRSEQAIRGSEQRYRLLVENSPTAIFLHELGGVFRYANRAAVELFGLDRAEALLGRNYLEFVHPDERAAAAERVRQFTERKREPDYVVRRIVRPSGEVRLISTTGIGFREGNRNLVQGIAQDITELRRSEELLRETDAKFSAAFQGSVDPMCIVRTRDGLILEANQAYEQLFGYSRKELVGHTTAELGLSIDPSMRATMVDKLLRERQVRDFPWRGRARTGEVHELLHSAFLIDGTSEPHHVAIIRDITERQRREKELRESEAKFSATFHASVDPIIISRLGDGLIIDVNEAYLRLTGCPREALIGMTTLQLGLVADPDGRAWRAAQAREHGSLRDAPSLLRTRSGELRDCLQTSFAIEVDGQPCWVSVMRDVTEAKRAERALQASEERLRQAVRASDIGIFDHDQRTGVLYWSPEMRTLFGARPDEQVSFQRFIAAVQPEDRERVRAAVERAHDPAGDGVFDVEYRIVRHDGGIRWLTTRSQTHFEGEASARHPVRTVGAVVDITERKRAEQALRESEGRLQQAVRVSGIGIFDHDQRTDAIYWSPEQRRIYGWGAEERVTLEKFIACVHPEDLEGIGTQVRRAHDPAGDGRFDVEHRIVRRDGETRWLTTRSQTFFEGKGSARHPVRTVGGVMDITERVQADQAIRHSEALLAEAQQTAHLGNFERNLVTGKAVWSDETYRLLGFEPGSVEPRIDSVLKVVHPDDREQFLAAYERGMKPENGGHYGVEHRVLLSDGSERILRHRATVTFDEAGRPIRIFGTSQDVTEARLSEQALRESETRFQTLIETVPDPIVVHVDGRHVYANPAALKLLGAKSVDEIVGSDALAIVHPDSRELVRERIRQHHLGEPVPRNVEVQWLRSDGTPIEVEITAVPFLLNGKQAVHVMARDISERKRAETALRASEERYRSVVSAMAEGVVLQDASGAIVTCNERARELLGLGEEELLGRTSLDPQWRVIRDDGSAFPGEQHPAMMTLRSGKPCLGIVMGVYRVHGSLVWLFVNSEPLFSSGKTAPDGVVTTFSDITEQRRMDAELRSLNQELEARVAERTAQLDAANKELEAFSSSVSHDLRAPLRHIVGYIDLLKRTHMGDLSDEGKRRLDIIADAARRMGNLIDSLLAFSRIGRQALQLGSVDLDALVRDVLQELQPETEGRDVIWEISPLPQVTGDRTLLKLVLTNLISNAVKFTRDRAPARITIGCDEADGRRVFFVKDNGAGFDMRYADKLFGVFQRLHSAEEFVGTGIGLANCKSIIERHGGRIWAQSAPNAGATFHFSLPRAARRVA